MVTTIFPDRLATTLSTNFTAGLDRFEEALPMIPARIFRLQRTIAGTSYDRYVSTVKAVTGSTKAVLDVALVSGKTVTGQARAATEDVTKATRTGVNTVVGQARAATGRVTDTARTSARTVGGQATAQGRKVSNKATKEATGLIDSAIESVEGDVDAAVTGAETATNRAAATTTPGSSRPYEQWTKAELLARAKELDIDGRSGMSKGQLIKALRA